MTVRTVGDLKELLEQFEDDQPVMLAHQPNWPLAEILGSVLGPDDNETEVCCEVHPDYLVGHGFRNEQGEYETCHWEPETDPEEKADNTVWLVAGGHKWDASPYAPRWVFGLDR